MMFKNQDLRAHLPVILLKAAKEQKIRQEVLLVLQKSSKESLFQLSLA